MTAAYVVFIRPVSLGRISQLCHLSLAFSKYIFAILTVTRVGDKNTREPAQNNLYLQKELTVFENRVLRKSFVSKMD
jgi:hypothetical protein